MAGGKSVPITKCQAAGSGGGLHALPHLGQNLKSPCRLQ